MKVFLSPSTQEFNRYFSGGSEEFYMNLLADVVEEKLINNGIEVIRNDRDKPLASAIELSNNNDIDLHLALHSNASPISLAGQLEGSDIYVYPGSDTAKKFADILEKNIKTIYPNPRLVNVRETTELGELQITKAPAVLFEVAYHDNPYDEMWILENINKIGDTVAGSVAEFFEVEYIS